MTSDTPPLFCIFYILTGSDASSTPVWMRRSVLRWMLWLLQDVHVRRKSTGKRHRDRQYGVSGHHVTWYNLVNISIFLRRVFAVVSVATPNSVSVSMVSDVLERSTVRACAWHAAVTIFNSQFEPNHSKTFQIVEFRLVNKYRVLLDFVWWKSGSASGSLDQTVDRMLCRMFHWCR